MFSADDFKLPVPSPTVVFKRLDEGGVLLSTSDEVYFGVNPVGARIWSMLPPVTETFEEMCTSLSHEYSDVAPERIRRDAREFIRDIVSAGLASVPPGDGSLESTRTSSSIPDAS